MRSFVRDEWEGGWKQAQLPRMSEARAMKDSIKPSSLPVGGRWAEKSRCSAAAAGVSWATER